MKTAESPHHPSNIALVCMRTRLNLCATYRPFNVISGTTCYVITVSFAVGFRHEHAVVLGPEVVKGSDVISVDPVVPDGEGGGVWRAGGEHEGGQVQLRKGRCLILYGPIYKQILEVSNKRSK